MIAVSQPASSLRIERRLFFHGVWFSGLVRTARQPALRVGLLDRNSEHDALAFEFKTCSKTYPNGLVALGDFSLKAQQGERLALIGQSGCGKSTALRLIAGLESPDNDASLTHNFKQSEAIGFVFQEPNLLPWATVFENIRLPLKLKGKSVAQCKEKVDLLISQLELDGFTDAYPRELSGGMKMRVSIGRALITDPEILLLDEPFSALDEITRFKLNDLVLDLHGERKFTLVLVTHSVFESVYLAERVCVMSPRPGRIIEEILCPRADVEDYRSHASYTKSCAAVSGSLRAAIAL